MRELKVDESESEESDEELELESEESVEVTLGESVGSSKVGMLGVGGV